MKKYIALFVIGVISAFGFNTATASAATNCNAIPWNGIYYNGYWNWYVQLVNCTQVDAVSFDYGAIDDLTHGGTHYAFAGGGQIGGAASSYGTTYSFYVWGSGCGYPAFLASKVFKFRLHNSVQHSWGGTNTAANVQQLC